MRDKFIDILECPICRSTLYVDNASILRKNDIIESGILRCTGCDEEFPIKNGIPRFVKGDDYVSSFSYEWALNKTTQLDSKTGNKETESTFKASTGLDLNKFKGKLILDAGCGVGRFMETVLNYDAKVVGVDLSFAIDVAQKNVGSNRKAELIQADIFNLPFKKETFEFIFSIGVLHHTTNTRKAFMSLVPYLKRGGEIAIWVYSDEGVYQKIYNRAQDFWRIFTTRLPPEKLYEFSKIWPNLMYPLNRRRYLRAVSQIVLPVSSYHHNSEWRILNTFDWLSPKYQWKHTYEEVEKWFKEAGLEDIEKLKHPIGVKARKP